MPPSQAQSATATVQAKKRGTTVQKPELVRERTEESRANMGQRTFLDME
ncbi:MAG: hypothetical protein SGJ09_02010 [Phycisphaerae bacterium]|nr:hypothetical protein [Phycisphaerae bacterium]